MSLTSNIVAVNKQSVSLAVTADAAREVVVGVLLLSKIVYVRSRVSAAHVIVLP